MDESETLLANMTLPPTPTSVIIGNLIAGSSYSIRAAAWTVAGVGPASDPATFTMEVLSFQQHPQAPTLGHDDLEGDMDDPYSHFDGGRINNKGNIGTGGIATPLMKETWIIVAIGVTLLAILCLFLAVLFIRRRWIRNKAMSSVQKTRVLELNGSGGGDNLLQNVCSGSSGNRDLIWSRGWTSSNGHHHSSRSGTVSQKEAELEAQTSLLGQGSQPYGNSAPPEYAELLNQQHGASHPSSETQSQLSLSSFLPRRNNNNSMMLMQTQLQTTPSAYATTTLVNPSAVRGQTLHGGGPYSGKSSGDSSSGSYVVDHSDRNGVGGGGSGSSSHSYHSRKNSNGFSTSNGNGVHHQQRIPNWIDLLPPPPRHPPPPSPAPNGDRNPSKDVSSRNQPDNLKDNY